MKQIGALLLLLLIAFGLYAVDLWGMGLSPLVRTTPWLLLVVALIDIDLLPATIWPAHLTEVVENFLFGLAAWVLRPLPGPQTTDNIPALTA
jgi:hypothetical protein